MRLRSPARNYTLIHKLGEGSFATVYKAIRSDGKLCAIKIIDLETSDKDLEGFKKEIMTLNFMRTKYIIDYWESFVNINDLWIVMEYMDCGSAHDLIQIKPFPEKIVAYILYCTLRALSALHKEQKIHRDVKAANILVSSNGSVKLADFGVSSHLIEAKTDQSWAGSPFWMAPEIIERRGHDYRADSWSLGITAIELALGRPPGTFLKKEDIFKHTLQDPVPKIPESFSKVFQNFVSCALKKNYKERFSAAELLSHPFLSKACSQDEMEVYLAESGYKSAIFDKESKLKKERKRKGSPFIDERKVVERRQGENWTFLSSYSSILGDVYANKHTEEPQPQKEEQQQQQSSYSHSPYCAQLCDQLENIKNTSSSSLKDHEYIQSLCDILLKIENHSPSLFSKCLDVIQNFQKKSDKLQQQTDLLKSMHNQANHIWECTAKPDKVSKMLLPLCLVRLHRNVEKLQ